MTRILCSIVGHSPLSFHHRNQGFEFSLCHHCGCDLIRHEEGGDWFEVPKGFQVIWRSVAGGDDAASVAERLQRGKVPPLRRHPRNAPPRGRRDPRGRPLMGAATLLQMLAMLGELIEENKRDWDKDQPCARIGRVICLPGTREGAPSA